MTKFSILDLIHVVSAQDSDSADVETAYQILVNQGEMAIEPLFAAIQASKDENRHMLASILCDILVEVGDDAALDVLQQLVDNDDNAIFTTAIRAIARFKHPQIDLILCEFLSHPAPQIRRVVAWQLGRNQADVALTALLNHLRETDTETLRGIIWSLGRLGKSNAIPALQPFLNHHQEDIAFIAREALERIQAESVTG